ncbi:thiamine-phosphate pyrophosphorylase [Pannonibacter phragmitetus]|uniref:thiamine phosphate synthase n=1 Tax=Pannonibacter phragmitetus TaxID=121719 RepID=UPI00067DD33C|nr:thiamine phosphate synthase [Pannonibacter phragmitetus]KND18451.1 thiamine-phosphate pyrophosphorylase [Pannonibacter phragmitetus]
MTLDPFYLIVDSADWIVRLVPQGVKLVQLRVKDCAPDELRRQIREAKAVCEAHGATLVLNDYWQMAIDEGCSWLHLGQEDLAEADLPAIRRAGLKLGLSTHDEAELETALAAKPDYVALGPVYPTILKEMKWAPQGLERLGIWKQRIGALPLIGIGGLTPERAEAALAAGADSAAVATDITRNADPEARVREWLAATARWR